MGQGGFKEDPGHRQMVRKLRPALFPVRETLQQGRLNS
jgi:hypothetical protein